MNKVLSAVFVVVVLGVAVFFLFRPSPSEPEPVVVSETINSLPIEIVSEDDGEVVADDVEESTSVAGISGSEKTAYTLTEVAKHDNVDDCWLVLDGKVYDVTEFVSSHPGGKAILEGCGKDATELFETRPMGSGTAHSERARALSEDYIIGDLQE
jgi:cytochrome b involved in lipid metabolism